MGLSNHKVWICLIWRQRNCLNRKQWFIYLDQGEVLFRSHLEAFVEREFLFWWQNVYCLLALIGPKVAKKLVNTDFKVISPLNIIFLRITSQANAHCLSGGGADDDLCVLFEVANVKHSIRLTT